jgi:hypothetical protein
MSQLSRRIRRCSILDRREGHVLIPRAGGAEGLGRVSQHLSGTVSMQTERPTPLLAVCSSEIDWAQATLSSTMLAGLAIHPDSTTSHRGITDTTLLEATGIMPLAGEHRRQMTSQMRYIAICRILRLP